jgi:hypothetical protein
MLLLHKRYSRLDVNILTRLGSGARVPTQSAHEAVPAGQPALHGIGPAANSRPYMGGLTAFPASATSVAACFTPVVSGSFVSCLSFVSSLFLSCLFPLGSGPKTLKEPDVLNESDCVHAHTHELKNHGTQETKRELTNNETQVTNCEETLDLSCTLVKGTLANHAFTNHGTQESRCEGTHVSSCKLVNGTLDERIHDHCNIGTFVNVTLAKCILDDYDICTIVKCTHDSCIHVLFIPVWQKVFEPQLRLDVDDDDVNDGDDVFSMMFVLTDPQDDEPTTTGVIYLHGRTPFYPPIFGSASLKLLTAALGKMDSCFMARWTQCSIILWSDF